VYKVAHCIKHTVVVKKKLNCFFQCRCIRYIVIFRILIMIFRCYLAVLQMTVQYS
jgi:hypothetical protein